ncbi:MBL fold metallo-hydrolase [Rhodobacterales bacterium 59_46_T64]|nr:MBL fold metallo-hydrolase [Rhodobacterales bacterium 59_46_T64]
MSFTTPNRRALLKLAAALPAFAMGAGPMQAAVLGAPDGGNPGHFHFTLGEMKLTVLSDGHFALPTSGLGVNAPREAVADFLAQHYLDLEQGYSHTNHLFVDTGAARILVDVGSGTRWFGSTGRLLANMEAAGIDPASITHVVITHAHPDHIWGIRDDFDEAIFPQAEYIMGAAEHSYWMQDGLAERVEPQAQQFVVGAVNSINCEGVKWVLADAGHEVVSGVRLIPTPGHTPGHMSLHLESNGQQLIALGDSMTHAHLNFAHPEWYNGTDSDGDLTVLTRKRLLARAAADRIAVLGYHFPFPGVGHVRAEGSSYRFLPALWQFE